MELSSDCTTDHTCMPDRLTLGSASSLRVLFLLKSLLNVVEHMCVRICVFVCMKCPFYQCRSACLVSFHTHTHRYTDTKHLKHSTVSFFPQLIMALHRTKENHLFFYVGVGRKASRFILLNLLWCVTFSSNTAAITICHQITSINRCAVPLQ